MRLRTTGGRISRRRPRTRLITLRNHEHVFGKNNSSSSNNNNNNKSTIKSTLKMWCHYQLCLKESKKWPFCTRTTWLINKIKLTSSTHHSITRLLYHSPNPLHRMKILCGMTYGTWMIFMAILWSTLQLIITKPTLFLAYNKWLLLQLSIKTLKQITTNNFPLSILILSVSVWSISYMFDSRNQLGWTIYITPPMGCNSLFLDLAFNAGYFVHRTVLFVYYFLLVGELTKEGSLSNQERNYNLFWITYEGSIICKSLIIIRYLN